MSGGNGRRPLVGVLALQGDYAAHARAMAARGVTAREVRRAEDLAGVDGVILPGGESTTMLKLMAGTGLAEALRALGEAGAPMLATCAGCILLAREVREPAQPSLGLLDVVVARNAYGRQLASAVVALDPEAGAELPAPLEGVFIRAPGILEVGARARVLARREGAPVLVEQGSLLGATFHPELSSASPVIDRFVARLREVHR